MDITTKSVQLEAYSKILNSDLSSMTRSAKSSASPLLIGDSDSDSSTGSFTDTVQISEEGKAALADYLAGSDATDEEKAAALGNYFRLGKSYFSENGTTNSDSLLEALSGSSSSSSDISSLLESIAEANKSSNVGEGHLSYNYDLSSLIEEE
jgi:hypothetical protein